MSKPHFGMSVSEGWNARRRRVECNEVKCNRRRKLCKPNGLLPSFLTKTRTTIGTSHRFFVLHAAQFITRNHYDWTLKKLEF
ncbi:hypothetical protein [uncultured Treponema sp.]|uniref:hypothetical protein n=1 Tax=uncultured Treponema sp. TaxID=162155 RepID=UPI0025F908A3|nr:hypothetical protein [uncultured Treponema sp.]